MRHHQRTSSRLLAASAVVGLVVSSPAFAQAPGVDPVVAPPPVPAPAAPLPGWAPLGGAPLQAPNPCVLSDAAGRCVQWASPPAPPSVAVPPAPPFNPAPWGAPATVAPAPTAPGTDPYDPAAPPAFAPLPANRLTDVNRVAAAKPLPGMVEGETEQAGGRTLLGHTFPLTRLVDSPFVVGNMYVGSSVEFFHQPGVSVRIPSPTTPGGTSTETFDRNISFVKLNYGVDFRPSEYFSFGLDADYLAEVGSNGLSLFTWGGGGSFDFRPNAKIRVLRSERTGSQLALRAHASFQQGIRVLPLGLLVNVSERLEDVVSDPTAAQDLANCLAAAQIVCVVTDEDITAKRQRNGGGASVAYGQALGRYAGFQVSLGLEGASTAVTLPSGGGESTSLDASDLAFHIGVAPSLNFYPKVPLGLTFEYRYQLDKSTYSANTEFGVVDGTVVSAGSHRMNAGLYYTGRRDLMLGWIAGANFNRDSARSMQNAETDPRAFVFAAQFDMRYFF